MKLECLLALAFVNLVRVVQLKAMPFDALQITAVVVAIVAINFNLRVRFLVIFQILSREETRWTILTREFPGVLVRVLVDDVWVDVFLPLESRRANLANKITNFGIYWSNCFQLTWHWKFRPSSSRLWNLPLCFSRISLLTNVSLQMSHWNLRVWDFIWARKSAYVS